MRKYAPLLLTLLSCSLCGCASFASLEDVKPPQTPQPVCRAPAPYALLEVQWTQFPIVGVDDYIREKEKPRTTVDDYTGEGKTPAVESPVADKDLAYLRKIAEKEFTGAGLLDPQKGSGTLRVKLVSTNRWTYSRLITTFLTDTGYIFIWPASLKVLHRMQVSACRESGCRVVRRGGIVNSIFHPVMLPLYPFTLPSGREHALLGRLLRDQTAQLVSACESPSADAPQKTPVAAPPAPATPQQAPAQYAPPTETAAPPTPPATR